MIPYAKELKGILLKCHNRNNHQNLIGTLEAIKNDNYYWVSMDKDVFRYIKRCLVCSKNKDL